MRALPFPLASRLPLAAAVALALAVAACDFEQVIEVELPPHEQRLVIGAFPVAGRPFTAQVGRTVPPTGRPPGSLEVTSARLVILDASGTVLDSLRYEAPPEPWLPGAYRAANGFRPEAGQTYRLTAEAPGFPAAHATTTLPTPVPVSATPLGRTTDPAGRPVYRLEVAFTAPGAPGVFALSVFQPSETASGPPSDNPHDDLEYRLTPFLAPDPILRPSLGQLDEGVVFDPGGPSGSRMFGTAYFRSNAFAGARRTFTVDVPLAPPEFGMPDPEAFVVWLGTLSEDYVRYQQTLALQQQSEGDPFAEPIRIYSNVVGGAGAFGGYAGRVAVAPLD